MYHARTSLPETITDLDANDPPQTISVAPAIPGFSPFPTMKDFLYAEEMITTCASEQSINFHLKHGYPENKLRSAGQIYKCVDEIASIYPEVCLRSSFLIFDDYNMSLFQFQPKSFDVPFKTKAGINTTLSYTVWVKDSMKALEELVRDPTLKDEWKWHARLQFIKTSKGDEQQSHKEELFITDPMSAKDAWEAEVCSFYHAVKDLDT